MTLEFNAILRDKGQANDDTKKLLLEVAAIDLRGRVEELTSLVNRKVEIHILPRYVSFSSVFSRKSGLPAVRYDEDTEGVWRQYVEEQLNLLDQNDVEKRDFEIEFDTIDEFINSAKLDYPGDIDPGVVLRRIEDNESLDEISTDYGFNEAELLEELNKAREYYAPYAAAWDEKRKREE